MVNEIMSSESVIVGSFASITAIINLAIAYIVNHKPNKKIKNLDETLRSYIVSNDSDHKKIMDNLTSHSNTISKYLDDRNIRHKISKVYSNAIEIVDDYDIAFCISRFCDIMSDFSECMLLTGINNVKQDFLHSRSKILKNAICKEISQYTKDYSYDNKQLLISLFDKYIGSILEIITDDMNSKTDRFFVKTEDFVQTIVKDGIKIYIKEKTNENKNK